MRKVINKRLHRLFLTFAIISSLICISTSDVYSQDAEFTQFYASPMFLNPAFAGTHMCPRLTLNHRNQWPGATTFITNAFSRPTCGRSSWRSGLMVVNDRMHSLQNNRVSGVFLSNEIIQKIFS